ncbi:MAG: hypothetical protein LBB76_10130 [Azoarcus sp.]|jgi:hypothetical protein|nr:hypothetical protein [Azoarcus sp.]
MGGSVPAEMARAAKLAAMAAETACGSAARMPGYFHDTALIILLTI